ncbi:hypothetical protein QBE52_08240 [Clostridiaceae bacterium 35-E11]
MTFAHQNSILLYDRSKNLYNFRWDEDKIKFTYFDKKLKKYDTTTLIEDGTIEFDSVIDEEDHVYIIYQNKSGVMSLKTLIDEKWNTHLLGEFNHLKIANLNLILHHKNLHIIYCIPVSEENREYKIYHHYYDDPEWKTLEVGTIHKKNLLNPFQILQQKKKMLLGFYDIVDHEEQIFIKEFDFENHQWKRTIQLTSSFEDKLYLDMMMSNPETLDITYSEYHEGNLVIKYEKHRLQEAKSVKVLETMLSNPSNCSSPTFVLNDKTLWNIWTEYDQVYSSFTKDEGLTWSAPYVWKESKEEIFFRHKFQTNDSVINAYYQLNHVFGKGYPTFSFIGFGSLDKAIEEPIQQKKYVKKKEKDEIEPEKNTKQEIQEKKEHDEIKEINISTLQKDIARLEERIKNIEDYIQRRRRGILFSPKR